MSVFSRYASAQRADSVIQQTVANAGAATDTLTTSTPVDAAVKDRSTALYTPGERARRDASIWTLVQGILAPLQLLVFAISLVLVLRSMFSGAGADVAALSVLVKTLVLYTIMVTGSIWEREVFGCWLFARPFFWEDVVSMGVIALHTLYLVMYLGGYGTTTEQLQVALLAYAAYLINAAQFLHKFRLARKSTAPSAAPAASS